MKTRIVHTKIHFEDDWFSSLQPSERYFYIYLFTNSHIGLTGIYELSKRVGLLETKLTSSQWDTFISKFQKSGKVSVAGDWIKIQNSDKYSNYSGEKNERAIQKELSLIPREIIDTLSIPYQYSSDTSINHKSEIINKKSVEDKSVREETKDPKSVTAKKLIDLFNKKSGHVYQLTDSVREKIYTRLQRYSEADLSTAITEMFKDSFYRGQNQRRWEADPSYLFRNDDNIEKFVAKTKKLQVTRLADIIK